MRHRLVSCQAHALDPDKMAVGRQAEASSDLVLAAHNTRGQDLGTSRKSHTRHLLGISEQPVEMNFGLGDKSSRAMAAFHHTFARQVGQRVPGCHQTHAVGPGKLSFRINHVARSKPTGLNLFTNRVLNPLIRRLCAVANSNCHAYLDRKDRVSSLLASSFWTQFSKYLRRVKTL